MIPNTPDPQSAHELPESPFSVVPPPMAKGIMVTFGPRALGNRKVEFAAITTGMTEDIVAVVVELFATMTTVWTAVAVLGVAETTGRGPSVLACKAEELGELDG